MDWTKHKSALVLLFVMSAVTILPASIAGTQSSDTFASNGSIAYWPRVYLDVNTSNTIGKNDFSGGFNAGAEWRYLVTRPALGQLAKDADFKVVRFFSVDLEPCSNWNETAENGDFDWTNVDRFVQKIYEVGAEPLVTIGYCDYDNIVIPPGMSKDPSTGLPYPESYASYCREWVRHFKDVGFSVRLYEVFNEAWWYFYPNWNWNQTKTGYFLQLFNACYDAMHGESPQICIGNDASLHRKFLDFWISQGGKLDMLSFHEYDCDDTNMNANTVLYRAEKRFSASDSLYYGVSEARQLWINARGVILPAIDSETNWSATCVSGTDPRMQQVVGTVWLALVLRKNMLEHVNYSAYFSFSSSKSWEQANKASGGLGFGMINHDDNMPWYPYLLQKIILTNLSVGDSILESSTSSGDIKSIAWTHGSVLNILLVCEVNEPRTVLLQSMTQQLNFTKIDQAISYLSPQLQVGKISASGNLVMNGYSVVLVQTGI